MPEVVVNTDNALDLHDEQYTSPVGGQNPGFFAWLSANYSDIINAGQGIACIVDPRRCAGGVNSATGETVVVKDDTSKMYFWILGAFMLIILIIVLIKK